MHQVWMASPSQLPHKFVDVHGSSDGTMVGVSICCPDRRSLSIGINHNNRKTHYVPRPTGVVRQRASAKHLTWLYKTSSTVSFQIIKYLFGK